MGQILYPGSTYPGSVSWKLPDWTMEPILKWPSPMPKATPPNPQPTRTFKQMVYPTTNKQLSAYEQTRGAYANSQRLTAQAGAYQQQQVNNAYAQRLTAQAQRSVGNASARASGDAWKAKYYQYFDQNRARLAESQRLTDKANAYLDVNVAPPFVGGGGSGSDYGGYGGYYSYGGGGGSYKPAPKPWYMSLTNWRI